MEASVCTPDTEGPSPDIYIPEEWSDAAQAIACDSTTSRPPVIVVCGPKNSGKSTFSRHLLNVLLLRYKRVAYLDTDVGQPEFTAPGCLSLIVIDKVTPDLTIPCLKTPERCYFFGDISSKRNPELYKMCVHGLFNHYTKEYRSNECGTKLPLIVNTPGWVKGIGYHTLVDMLDYISPTHVVKINISVESKNLPDGAFWLDHHNHSSVSLIEISPARRDSNNRSILSQKEASHARDIRLIAYFRQCFPGDMSLTKVGELAHALASHPPYEVLISSVNIEHLHCQVLGEEVLYSLNATIVGLAVRSENADALPICVGLGIVRGIDTSRNVLYLITPVPPSVLQSVDLLLQGFIQIPTRLLQEKGCMSPYMSANVISLN